MGWFFSATSHTVTLQWSQGHKKLYNLAFSLSSLLSFLPTIPSIFSVHFSMKTFTGLAIAAGLAATATALPAQSEKRQVYTEKYQGTPGGLVKYDKNGIPVSCLLILTYI